MEIKVEDLEVGDEILVPTGSNFAYAIVLKLPVVKAAPSWHIPGMTYYKTVKCSVKIIEQVKHFVSSGRTYTSKKRSYILTNEDHNFIKYIDFNGKNIWLIDRKQIK